MTDDVLRDIAAVLASVETQMRRYSRLPWLRDPMLRLHALAGTGSGELLPPEELADRYLGALTIHLGAYDREHVRSLEARNAQLEHAMTMMRGTYGTQFCMDRDLDMVISASSDCSDGDRIRATDTGREFVMRDGAWFEERPWRPATTAGMDDAPVALTPVDGIVNRYRDPREMIMGTRLLDSLTPAEIKTAVAAEMEDQGFAESYQILGAVARRCRSSQDSTGTGYKWDRQKVADRYFGRVKRALESLASDGALIKDPGKGYRGAPVYYTPAAWQERQDGQARAAAIANEHQRRWDAITERMGSHGFHLTPSGTLSVHDWERLATVLDDYSKGDSE